VLPATGPFFFAVFPCEQDLQDRPLLQYPREAGHGALSGGQAVPNLAAAVNHANNYWYRPCADGQVWTPNTAVNVLQECRSRNLDPAQWVGRFLLYDRGSPNETPEGLFLVPAAVASPATMKARGFHSRNYPDKVFLCSWSDSHKDSSEGQTPQYTGLNDCSHFVSECLQKGGVDVWSLNAPDLVQRVRARSDTRTLCLHVNKEAARVIINSGLMTPGDVMAFSYHGGFKHAGLYLGERMVAMHTYFNHPDGDDRDIYEDSAGLNNWEGLAHPGHPNVTLIHFNHRDLNPRAFTLVHGWWKVTAQGRTYYYHFTADGRAGWVSKAPMNLTAEPVPAEGSGYWFTTPGELYRGVSVCWRSTGTLERFRQLSSQAMTGQSTYGMLSAARLGP
jgi:hypothetical protein